MKRLSVYLLLISALLCNHLSASGCDYYKNRLEHIESLLRIGGSAAKMNRLRAQQREIEDQLYRCRNDVDMNPSIETAQGPTAKKQPLKNVHQPARRSDTADPQVQRLLETCNYWIELNNASPSQDNINFRDTACRAVATRERELSTPTAPSNSLPARKLKDCIKPNNLVDNDVNECLQGTISPTWR